LSHRSAGLRRLSVAPAGPSAERIG